MAPKGLFIAGLLIVWLLPEAIYAKPNQSIINKVEETINLYRRGRYSKKRTWVYLNSYAQRSSQLDSETLSRIKAVQSQLLFNDSYPILASIYASESIILSRNPLQDFNTSTWKILREASTAQPIDYILDQLTLRYMSLNENPKFFGSDWNYFVAIALINKNKTGLARDYLAKIKMKDRYFLPAQYQLAIIDIDKGRYADAEAKFKSILNEVPQRISPLAKDEKKKLIEYTHLALARLYYERQKFILSAYHYRKLGKESSLFYDSLFEQSWAFFMAGKPKHALGSLYGAHTPYFSHEYNPEGKILESMIYFWMCRYDEARNALADFAQQHAQSVEGLKTFLDRQRLSPQTTYQLFENLVSGVSSSSLGISRRVLESAAERDAMKLIRSQYASVLEELERLETNGVFNSKRGQKILEERLEKLALNLQVELGSTYLTELRHLNDHYSDLYTQAQFLYLELLMGQKEHVLGRELHADSKVRKVTGIDREKIWSQKTQSWKDEKFEYWWDEVGYQVIDIEPLCN